MRKILITAASAASAALFLCVADGSALADEHEGEGLKYIPIEGFSCKYRDGKGPSDLKAVNEEWNAWMDENDANDYFAAIMTPHYHSDLDSVDVIWVGGYRDGNAMGVGTDKWMNEGGDVGVKYYETLDCDAAYSFIGTTLRAPKDGDDDSDDRFVVSFSNCSLKEEGEEAWENFRAAQKAWNAYADENGIDGSVYLWWPLHGESADADYDFKYIVGYDDHTMRGAAWQKYADGHWVKDEELFGGLLDCDSSRLYDAKVVRDMADE